MGTHRIGREPLSARSPLHLRFVLAAFGAVVLSFGAFYAFSRPEPATGVVFLGGVSAVFAIVALIDMYVIAGHLKHQDR